MFIFCLCFRVRTRRRGRHRVRKQRRKRISKVSRHAGPILYRHGLRILMAARTSLEKIFAPLCGVAAPRRFRRNGDGTLFAPRGFCTPRRRVVFPASKQRLLDAVICLFTNVKHTRV